MNGSKGHNGGIQTTMRIHFAVFQMSYSEGVKSFPSTWPPDHLLTEREGVSMERAAGAVAEEV